LTIMNEYFTMNSASILEMEGAFDEFPAINNTE